MAKSPNKPPKKRVSKAGLKDIELHPDAWERFEKGIKQIAKAEPTPTKKSKG